jgi:hypothetical protein
VIVHDAASAFVALIHAVFAWAAVLAGVAAMVLCAVPLCVAPGVRAVRKRVTGPSWARGPLRARILARTRARASQAPSEASSYREAA